MFPFLSVMLFITTPFINSLQNKPNGVCEDYNGINANNGVKQFTPNLINMNLIILKR